MRACPRVLREPCRTPRAVEIATSATRRIANRGLYFRCELRPSVARRGLAFRKACGAATLADQAMPERWTP